MVQVLLEYRTGNTSGMWKKVMHAREKCMIEPLFCTILKLEELFRDQLTQAHFSDVKTETQDENCSPSKLMEESTLFIC